MHHCKYSPSAFQSNRLARRRRTPNLKLYADACGQLHAGDSKPTRLTQSYVTANGGFALVIALGMMSFVILLLLSLTTFVRVETQSSAIAMAQLEARENARFAAMQALGNLQKSMGPDQRISFNAAMFDANPNTPELETVANPLWVAAVRTVADAPSTNPEQFQENNRKGVLGFDTEDMLLGNRLPSVDRADTIEWLVSSTHPQAQPAARINPADPILRDAAAIMGGADNVIEIARRKYTHVGGTDEVSVEVGRVPLLDSAGAAKGAFAWWVEDEGLKAQFNLDRQIPTATQTPYNPELFRIMRAQGASFAHSGISGPSFDDLLADDLLSRLHYSLGKDLFSPEWSQWLDERSADIGFGSYTIPVDVVEGRLKEDLTVYLETEMGLNPDDDMIRGGSGDNNFSGTPRYLTSYENMPKFGILRTWNEIGKEVGADSPAGITISSRAQTDTEHGFHPQVKRTGVRIVPVIEGQWPDSPIRDDEGNVTNDTTKEVEIFLLIAPFVELWNPYSVPIPPEKYLVEIAMPNQVRFGRQETLGSRGELTNLPNLNEDEILAVFDLRTMVRSESYTFGSQRAWIKLVVDTGDLIPPQQHRGMMPGESILFSPFPEFPAPAFYVDQPASSYNANSDDNLAIRNWMNPDDQGQSGHRHFRFPETRTVTLDSTLRYGTDVGLTESQRDFGQGVYHRMSLLTDSGPELLTASSALMADTPVMVGQSAGRAFADANRHDRLSSSVNWTIRYQHNQAYFAAAKNIHRVARVPAVMGGSLHGGDLEISLRNPLQGFLRQDLAMPTSTDSNFLNNNQHRTNLFFQDYRSHYDFLFRVDLGPWGNEGVLPGAGPNAGPNVGPTHAHFDFPRQYGPIHSLGQLMHANLNHVPFGPSHVLGYSRAPFVTSDGTASKGRERITQTANTIMPNERVDLAWLANASLWDRFYLSTIPQTGAFNPADRDTVLPNNRLRIMPDRDGQYPPSANMHNSQTAFERSAANVLVEGSFNVNSTSVEAWTAFLLSKAGTTVRNAFGGTKTFSDDYNPSESDEQVLFPRYAKPVFGIENNDQFDTQNPRLTAFFRAGLHVTSSDEIRRLAEVIVAEVKRRGPFLSMADFINRRLIPDQASVDGDYIGLMGTLDAAIHRTSHEPDMLNYNLIFGDAGNARGTTLPLARDVLFNLGERRFGVPGDMRDSALEAYPSYLLQADILAHLGSQMSVRSDTFTIHGYGNKIDPITGRIVAEARCEMVVQRMADTVDETDDIISPNGNFGRRFVVLAFRWID